MLLIVFILAYTASAAIEVESSDLTFSVSYEKLRDDDKKLSVSQSITLKNTGSALESVTVGLQDLGSDYQLSVNPSTVQLAAGASQELSITGKIPVNIDQGINDIGKLKVTTSLGQSSLHTLRTDVKSMLELNRITVFVNGFQDKIIDEDKEKVKDLKPGDKVELRFRLENLFDEDYDFGDIDGTIASRLDDSDYDEDIDEEESFDVDAGTKLDAVDEEIVFTFTIPEKAESGDYILEVKIEAKDENKAKYDLDLEMTLQIERNKDDVRIASLAVTPTEVSCFRKAQIAAEVANFGDNKQKHAALTLINTDLGLNMKYDDFALDEGTSDSNAEVKQLTLDIDQKVKPGTYPIVATAFFDYNTFSDKKSVDVVVKSCTSQQQQNASTVMSTTNESNNVTTATVGNNVTQNNGQQKQNLSTAKESTDASAVPPAAKQLPQQDQGVIVKTLENPYTTRDYLLAGIIVAIVLVVAIIVLFVILLL